MHKIIFKQELAPNIKKIVVEAPLVAKKVSPGQFIVIILDEKGERIPLTVAETDKARGTLTLIFQEVGKTTFKLGRLKAKEEIHSLLGPLGKASEIKKLGTALVIGGGVGIAEIYPLSKAFKQAGNKIITIIGARSKNLLILEKELRQLSDELLVVTDDGSSGRKGLVTDVLKEVLKSTPVDLIYAVGPVAMMRAVCRLSEPLQIKTLVSLNPIMVDATGMCGSCRVELGGQTLFGCVDGPEFDGHLVDFDQLEKRLNLFLAQEKQALRVC